MKRICTRCKEKNEEETHFHFRTEQGKYRTICAKCRNSDKARYKSAKKKINEEFYWKVRTIATNTSSRRAKKRYGIVAGSVNHIELMNLYYSNPFCYYCKLSITKEEAEIEHTIPLSRGGEHEISNITMCCKDCNRLKGTRTEEEFKVFLNEYVNRFIRTAI